MTHTSVRKLAAGTVLCAAGLTITGMTGTAQAAVLGAERASVAQTAAADPWPRCGHGNWNRCWQYHSRHFSSFSCHRTGRLIVWRSDRYDRYFCDRNWGRSYTLWLWRSWGGWDNHHR